MKYLFKRVIYSTQLLLLLVTVPVSASYTCVGKMDHFQITASGYVQVTSNEVYGDNIGRAVCNITASWKNVTTQTCKAWVAMLLAAEKSNTIVRIQYRDSLSCTTQPTWGDAEAPWVIDT